MFQIKKAGVAVLLFLLVLVLVLLIGGCAAEVNKEKSVVSQKVSDEQILKEYPDGLDDAIIELDKIE